MIVCKFGGSSLADAGRVRACAEILRADAARRFAVVSAPGKRFAGDEKITDLLLRAAGGDARALDTALERFAAMAAQLGVNMEGELRRAAAEVPIRGTDYAASRGEYLCALLLAKYLGWAFVDAAEVICLRAGRDDVEESCARLLRRLKPLRNAVIPGFYGADAAGGIRTFPRGGSDITGALVAAALGARLYENWTDVDGLRSADPQLVEGTVRVPTISYRQMRLLSRMGAQVLHPDSLFPVMRAGIPTALKDSFHPERPGTLVRAGKGTRVPCVSGRTLRSGEALLAALCPDAFAACGAAVEALRGAGIQPRGLEARRDQLLLRVRGRCLSDGLRALHRALVVEGRAQAKAGPVPG